MVIGENNDFDVSTNRVGLNDDVEMILPVSKTNRNILVGREVHTCRIVVSEPWVGVLKSRGRGGWRAERA